MERKLGVSAFIMLGIAGGFLLGITSNLWTHKLLWDEKAAAWFQAIASVVAICAAAAVPILIYERDKATLAQLQRQRVRNMARFLKIGLSATLKDTALVETWILSYDELLKNKDFNSVTFAEPPNLISEIGQLAATDTFHSILPDEITQCTTDLVTAARTYNAFQHVFVMHDNKKPIDIKYVMQLKDRFNEYCKAKNNLDSAIEKFLED